MSSRHGLAPWHRPHTPSVACPSVFRRPRLTIVGCGDVGLRIARHLTGRPGVPWRLFALSSTPARRDTLRATGLVPIAGNLDERRSLARIAALAPWVIHLAPPSPHGLQDLRTAALMQGLAAVGVARRLVYGSTTGVYGDAHGERFDETRPVAPASDRARRRADAERRIRRWGRQSQARVSVLRIPGIYAGDREGGHPHDRLLKGTPVLREADDVYTNHIHADDLARIALGALWRAAPQRVFNACDDTEMKMGDYFDLAAHFCGLPRPPRVSRVDAARHFSPVQLSFMAESRRLINHRIKQELRIRLQHPTVAEGLRHG